MTEFLAKLSIYEQLGYLLVGGLGLFLAWCDLVLIGHGDFARVLQEQNLVVLLIASFFLGHLVQAVANLIFPHPVTGFKTSQQEILAKARKYFDLQRQSDGEVWMLCYARALVNDFTGQVNAFNAYYGLYRGWAVCFAVESTMLVEAAAMIRSLPVFALSLASALAAVLFTRRSKRFYVNLTSKVLHAFMVLVKREESDARAS